MSVKLFFKKENKCDFILNAQEKGYSIEIKKFAKEIGKCHMHMGRVLNAKVHCSEMYAKILCKHAGVEFKEYFEWKSTHNA